MIRVRTSVALLLAVALGAQLPFATAAQEPPAAPQAPAKGEARILGRVMDADKTPVRGAKVLAFHLSYAQTFSSSETDDNGRFEIVDLPYGYFDIAVSSPDGLFVANEVVNVPPSGKVALSMTLVPSGTGAAQPRGFSGLDQTPSGIAQVDSGKAGGFWGSAKGLAILGGIGGVTLLALALSGGGNNNETPVSPVNP